MNVSNLTDRWLIEQFLLWRSERAFVRLYERHQEAIYRFALQIGDGDRNIAMDLSQTTWLQAVKNLSHFRGESSLRTWLIRILIFSSKSYFRKIRTYVQNDLYNQELSGGPTSDYEQLDLESALKKLPTGYYTVLILHDVEGFKHREISELLGITEGTSKSQLFHARRMVRNFLNN